MDNPINLIDFLIANSNGFKSDFIDFIRFELGIKLQYYGGHFKGIALTSPQAP